MISCPHGGGPVHLLVDLWWIFVIVMPGLAAILVRFGIKVPKCFCCKHKDGDV